MQKVTNSIRSRILKAVIFSLCTPLFFGLPSIGNVLSLAQAAAGVPQIISYQGRLTDASGTLLGTASGTAYFFKFSIYDAASGGTKLWPSTAPASTSATVTSGVFNVKIGDTGSGYPDSLDFNFEDNDTIYLQVDVASSSSGTYESITPRQRITSAGYAINSKTLRGFVPSQMASGSNVPVLSSGNLTLGGAAPQINATSTNNLVIQGGAGTGDLILVTNGGRVGIGTTSPSSTLHVIGAATISATTTIQGKLVDASGNAYVTSTVAGSGTVSTSTAVTANYFPFWGSVSALSGTSTIYASGTRIGIGTIAPSSTLHIIGDFQTSGTSTIGGSLLDAAGNKYTTTTANGITGAISIVGANGITISSSSQTITITDLASSTWLKVANNFSDINNTSTARTNLGLGDSATLASSTWLKVANNLSDLTTTSTARTNLGLGTAAVQNIGAFLQVANNGSDISSTSTFRTNLGLGDSATLASSTWLKTANNFSDINNTSTARTNLGLGDSATLASSTWLKAANNFSELTSTSTARTNLGLGTAAVQNIGAFLQTANNLSDLTATSTARVNIGLGSVSNALQLIAANNLSDVTSTSTARTNLGLGDSATLASSTWLKTANNFSDINNTSTARTNLGLGDSATLASSTWLKAANNLSDLTATATARTNLGVGTVANGGTGNTSYTSGSIIFASSTTLLGESNANLFWNNTNSRLGIGTSAPSSTLHVVGTLQIPVNTSPTIAGHLMIQTTSSTLVFRDDTSNRVIIATSSKGIAEVSPTASEKNFIYVFPAKTTIAAVYCVLGNAPGNTLDFNLVYGSTYASTGQLFASNQTCTATTTPTTYASFASSTPLKGDMIWLTTSATSSAVSTTQAAIQFDYYFNE